MNTVAIQLGEFLFQFNSMQGWVNAGPRPWRTRQATGGRAIAIDAKGRVCQCGAHFKRAAEDDAYPVKVYRTQPDDPDNGAEPDLSERALFGEGPS